MYLIVLLFSLSVWCVQGAEPATPAPPITGDFGGSTLERLLYFEKYLETGTREQQAVYCDDNPLLREVVKVFNTTVLTQLRGYLAHKSMLASEDKQCDQSAVSNADRLMRTAFDKSVTCLAEFRQRVRTEVDKTITEIVNVPLELRTSLILPVDECLENAKFDAMKSFGQNLADHIVCVKKIPQKKL